MEEVYISQRLKTRGKRLGDPSTKEWQEQIVRLPYEIALNVISKITRIEDLRKMIKASRSNEMLKNLLYDGVVMVQESYNDDDYVADIEELEPLYNLRTTGNNFLIWIRQNLKDLTFLDRFKRIDGSFLIEADKKEFQLLARLIIQSYIDNKHKERILITNSRTKDILWDETKYEYIIIEGNAVFVYPFTSPFGDDDNMHSMLINLLRKNYPQLEIRTIYYSNPGRVSPNIKYLVNNELFILRPAYMKLFSKAKTLGTFKGREVKSYSGFKTGIVNVHPPSILLLYIETNVKTENGYKVVPEFEEFWQEINEVFGKIPEKTAADTLKELELYQDYYFIEYDARFNPFGYSMDDYTSNELYPRELNLMYMPDIQPEDEFNDTILTDAINKYVYDYPD